MATDRLPTRRRGVTAKHPRPKPNGEIRTPLMPAMPPIWLFGR